MKKPPIAELKKWLIEIIALLSLLIVGVKILAVEIASLIHLLR